MSAKLLKDTGKYLIGRRTTVNPDQGTNLLVVLDERLREFVKIGKSTGERLRFIVAARDELALAIGPRTGATACNLSFR